MRRFSLLLLILLIAPLTFATGWKKPYYSATKSGSWARYSDDAGETKMTTITKRLADGDEGAVRINSRVEFANNQYPPVVNEYTLKSGFPLDRELIDYMSVITAGAASASNGELQPFDADTLNAIRTHSDPYGPVVLFKTTEIVGGRNCDRYSYTLRHPGDPVTIESGDLWMSDDVPFGVVKQTSTTRDVKGKTVSSYTRTLEASGASGAPVSGPASDPKLAATKGPPTFTLQEAFNAGVINIRASVDAATKGARAHLQIESRAEHALILNVPKGTTSLHVGLLIDDFVMQIDAPATFRITAGFPAELDVEQLGRQRVTKGRFEMSVVEGSTLFGGNCTIGLVEE